MPDNLPTPPAPAATNPFNDNDWKPPVPVSNESDITPTPGVPALPVLPVDPVVPPVPAAGEDSVDADVYLKEQLGFDSWEAAKTTLAEVNELREKAKTPAEYKYANEQSEKIAKAINDGNDEEVWKHLDQKRKVTAGKNLDPSNTNHAVDIVKLSWQLQNQDLSTEDVDYMFRKRFTSPRKPVQAPEQSDADYALDMEDWQSKVKDVERELIIEAKMAKPKLAQYEPNLVLPNTSKKENTPATPVSPTPEELAKRAEDRQMYISVTDAGIKNLKEFKTQVKDEEVELPISYIISDEERANTKAITEGLYSSFDYFIERWKNPDGTLNEAQQAEDITLLENKQKILQKIANEGAAKRLAHKVTVSKNPVVTPPSNGNKPVLQTEDNHTAMVDFWKNS